MNFQQKNTILITGGASGIGWALAKKFLPHNSVILVGRRMEKLQEAQETCPPDQKQNLHILQGDVETEEGRVKLFKDVMRIYPHVNILLNNAGIQRTVDLLAGVEQPSWKVIESEIQINLCGPIHLALLFMDHLKQQPSPCIINVTSGLSFVPKAEVPVYCSTKAALHSFTWSLRHQLKDSPIKVVEIVPPAVDTDLQAPGLHTFGVNVDVFAKDIYEKLLKGEEEVGYGMAEQGRLAYRNGVGKQFEAMNNTLK